MSDVVERLMAGAGGGKRWMDLHTEAAHEITRLRAALEIAMLDDRTASLIRALIDVGTRKVVHVDNGSCPDQIEGRSTRDDECPACRVLSAAQELLDS